MTKNFEMSLNADFKLFLGFQIQQFQEGIFLSQAKYLKDILEKFGMSDASPCKTPMPTKITLTEDTNGTPFDPSTYHSMIGSLLWENFVFATLDFANFPYATQILTFHFCHL